MTTDCRVRRLKVRLEDRSSLPRIAFLLEDALRTAAFPGIPANGLVFVKRLELGPIDAAAGGAWLSRKIDDMVRNLRPVRIQGPLQAGADPPAVWFADALEPCRLLVAQLAAGHRPGEWFWPAAVSGWSSSMAVDRSLRGIVRMVAQTPSGISGLSEVLEPLIANGRILDLLQHFDEAQIHDLARAARVPLREVPRGAGSGPQVSDARAFDEPRLADNVFIDAAHRAVIARAIRRWGFESPRSVFLAAVVTGRTAGAAGPGRMRRILAAVMQAASSSGQPPQGARRRTRHRTYPAGLRAAAFGAGGRRPSAGGDPAASPQSAPSPMPAGGPPSQDHGPEDRPGEAPPGQAAWEELRAGMGRKALRDALRHEEIAPESAVAAPAAFDRARGRAPLIRDIHSSAGEPSRFAGFFLLITILERLGIEDFFADDLLYAPGDLYEFVLWAFARRCHIPPEDPALAFLSDPADIDRRIAQWHIGITRRDILENARPHIQTLFRFPRSRDPLAPLTLQQVVQIVRIAIGRYVRRQAGMTVGRLIRRSALIAQSRTHIDITLPMRTLDIRIRMAGLDIDPGWVPWLQRVVRFHYTEEDIGL